jgi:thiosulfate/3-mercaptopyruvate sulfurtransferase
LTEAKYQYPEALVSCDWLQAHLDDPDLRIYDCTVYLHPETGTDRPYRVESGRADYDAGHIPGAGFLDLQDDFSQADSPYRFTILSPEETATSFARQGVGNQTRVILYSRKSMQWSTRFWWMLRSIGFDNVAILDGGIDKWIADGHPISTAPCSYGSEPLSSQPRPGLFVDKDTVLDAIDDTGVCTINALSPDLHSGADPRYGRPGRIPGSVNIPAAALLDRDSQEVLPPDITAQKFTDAGADRDKKIIAYCGGGIAATMDAFILHQLGYTDIAVYDSSMSEWVTDPSLPMETD